MKIVAGLGNPGLQYAATRHNIGFMVLDRVIKGLDKREGQIIFCRPKSYMNNSGHEVSKLVNYYKVKGDDLWVIHDDVDIPFGLVRARRGGSSGGHNGIKSIIEQLGHGEFNRIRVGIGRDQGVNTADYVLAKFRANEIEQLELLLDRSAEFVIDLLCNGMRSETQDFLNTK